MGVRFPDDGQNTLIVRRSCARRATNAQNSFGRPRWQRPRRNGLSVRRYQNPRIFLAVGIYMPLDGARSAHNQGILTTSGKTNKNKPPIGRHLLLEGPRTYHVRLGVCHVRPCVCRVCLVGCNVFSRAINRELVIGRVEYGTLARVGVWPGLLGWKRLRFGNVLHDRTA